jgi:hypothetical protein
LLAELTGLVLQYGGYGHGALPGAGSRLEMMRVVPCGLQSVTRACTTLPASDAA